MLGLDAGYVGSAELVGHGWILLRKSIGPLAKGSRSRNGRWEIGQRYDALATAYNPSGRNLQRRSLFISS
jgi:hypothetical protein